MRDKKRQNVAHDVGRIIRRIPCDWCECDWCYSHILTRLTTDFMPLNIKIVKYLICKNQGIQDCRRYRVCSKTLVHLPNQIINKTVNYLNSFVYLWLKEKKQNDWRQSHRLYIGYVRTRFIWNFIQKPNLSICFQILKTTKEGTN